MLVARTVSFIIANARSATPSYLGLFAGVNSDTTLATQFPKTPSKNSPPLSHLTAITADDVPSAQTSARDDSNALAAPDFLFITYTNSANHVQSSRTIIVYSVSPLIGTVISRLRSTSTRCIFSSAPVGVDLAMGFRNPFAIEHPRHSWSSSLRLTPCCSAVSSSNTSYVSP